MHKQVTVLAAAIMLAPLGARAADLVVWWEQGSYAQEDEAVREIIAAFEQDSGKRVELTQYPIAELPDKIEAALAAGQPPDFAFGLRMNPTSFRDGPTTIGSWTLRALSDISRTCSIRSPSGGWSWSTRRPGRTALYALPMGRTTNHVHVWKSLLEQAGFTLADVPKGVGRLLGVLVRPGTARSAPGDRARRHLGGRPLHVRRARRHSGGVLSVLGCLRCRLREPRRPARHRRSGGPAQADRGDRRVHRGLSQGLHPARLDHLGLRLRQQRAVSGAGDRHDAEP